MLVHYNHEIVDSIRLAVNQATFTTYIEESFEGEIFHSEDDDAYLYLEKSGQLIHCKDEENGVTTLMLMEADENFYHWLE